MKPVAGFAACVIFTLFAAVEFPQIASAQTSTSPSAYVYLINGASNNTSELDGYRADSTGALTRLPGSPFWRSTSPNVGGIALTAHWLFATDGTSIYSFSIAANGALTKVSPINAEQHSECHCGSIGSLFLDHTGLTLYALSIYDDGSNNTIQFFHKNGTTGALTFFGSASPDSAALWGPLSFIGNNEYGYNASCIQQSPTFYTSRRNSDGTLTRFLIEQPVPTVPNDNYCTFGQAADPTVHLAVGFVTESTNRTQLGVYTADSGGNLTTTSTYQNMPSAAVGTPSVLLMSPGGSLLAVAGTKGLQVFHFHGSNPITSYTNLIAAHAIYDLAWDTHNHLYAIGSGRVNAFRVTTTGYKQASGSPYAINAKAIAVLSK
jgi:hypothetical protein